MTVTITPQKSMTSGVGSKRGVTVLPEITWEEKEKKCCDCNNPTHLHWQIETIEWWLCQGCAKRRGDPYALTIRAFTSFFEAKAENWLMKRILV